MESDKIELAERLVNSSRWYWMPGMRTISGRRLAVVFGKSRTASVLCDLRDDANSDTEELQGELPDLTDAATVGCLLALVREAWGSPGFYTARGDVRIKDTDLLGWDFFGYLRGKSCKGMLYRSEAEALVAALEGAP